MASVHPSSKYKNFPNISEDRPITDILGNPIFETNADLYCYLAALGLKQGKRVKTGKRDDGWGQVRDSIFDGRGLMPKIYTVVLADCKEYSVLKDVDKCFLIFEEYVNSGFEELKKISQKSDNEEEFIELLVLQILDFAQKNLEYEDVDSDLDNVLDLED